MSQDTVVKREPLAVLAAVLDALPSGTPDAAAHALLASSFIGALPTADIQALFQRGTPAAHGRNEVLLAAADPSDRLWAVLQGHAKEFRVLRSRQEVVLSVLGPGDVIGAQTVLEGPPVLASVAVLDRVETMVIPGADVRGLATKSPAVATALLRHLAHRLVAEQRERVEATVHDSRVRVGRRLVQLAERWGRPEGGSIVIAVSLSQEEIGAWAGVSREATVKTLSEFRRRGWIETGRRWIRVLDLEAVRRRARWPSTAG